MSGQSILFPLLSLRPLCSVVKYLPCNDSHLGRKLFYNFEYRVLVYGKYMYIILWCLLDPFSSFSLCWKSSNLILKKRLGAYKV